MKLFLKLTTLLACQIMVSAGAVAQVSPGWTLVWSDEFTQADGSSPDSTKWTYETGTGSGGWGNNELEYYTSRTNNARIENGQLVIEARQESYLGSAYTSARLKTQGKATWTYGRMEARMKIPRGQGIWPAFWMLGANFPSAGWPTCGEIDILENIGSELTTVHGTLHGPGYSGGNGISGPYSLPGNAVFADDFHLYAVEWTTNQIKWLVDSQQYFSVAPASLPGGATWVFTQPQFLLLNLAVGGNWPGNPSGSTVFPQRLIVDYVRVYAVSNALPSSSGTLINGNFESGLLAPWVGKDGCCANAQGAAITSTNGLVWDPTINANNNQGIRNPAFGAYACKTYGNFSGGMNSPGFFQDVAALPGSIWNASIKARTQSTDQIRDGNQAVVEVSFLGTTDNLLAKFASPMFNTNMPINTWIDLNVTQQTFPALGTTNLLRAPAGTAKARFEVTFSQTLYEWGSIYFDQARLQEVARPILSASLNASTNILISFPTQPGVNYQMLYKNQVGDSNWTPIQTIAGDGTAKSVSYAASAPARFYAVQMF